MATYTDNYSLTKPTFAEVADIRTINGNMDTIDDIMHASQVSLADAYDQTATYNTGDVVMYEFLMYKCLATTTGNWDATKWERTTASESGGGGSAELDILGEGNGAVVSFADGASAELAKCIAEITPKQAGSGTPSPSNVRAISGYTAVKVNVSGKNLCLSINNATWNEVTTSTSNGATAVSGTATSNGGRNTLASNDFILSAGTYTLSHNGTGTWGNELVLTRKRDSARLAELSANNSNVTFTIESQEECHIGINVINGTSYSGTVRPQIEIGSESSAFEPYNGNTYTTPLGQTVYGGRLNVLTGELTIDRVIITITSESQFTTFSADSTYGSLVTIASDGKADNSNIMSISDMALGISNNDRVSPDYVSLDRCYIDDNGRVRLRASKDVTISTKADMLARFLNAQVVYILATPQTVQLTPQEVNSLLGQNNISADTGDIDIVYVKASAPIQPNPTGTPTATLKKLGIEGTVFEVEGGGGGSSVINYSTTEQVIGTWIDGKNIYERTYTGSFAVPSGGTWYDTGIALSDVENLIDTQCRQSIAKWNFISGLNNSGTLVLVNPTSGSLSVENITIQYTKITD